MLRRGRALWISSHEQPSCLIWSSVACYSTCSKPARPFLPVGPSLEGIFRKAVCLIRSEHCKRQILLEILIAILKSAKGWIGIDSCRRHLNAKFFFLSFPPKLETRLGEKLCNITGDWDFQLLDYLVCMLPIPNFWAHWRPSCVSKYKDKWQISHCKALLIEDLYHNIYLVRGRNT